MPRKTFAYLCTESTYHGVKAGEVLQYKRNRGPWHSEDIINTKTGKDIGYFYMVRIGACWVVDGLVQFEEPPLERGELTRRILNAPKPKKAK